MPRCSGPHKEEGEEDDHERSGLITSRRPWQPGILMSKMSRTVRGGEEVARNVRKGCRTHDEEEDAELKVEKKPSKSLKIWGAKLTQISVVVVSDCGTTS
jgi:hypothetical protein